MANENSPKNFHAIETQYGIVQPPVSAARALPMAQKDQCEVQQRHPGSTVPKDGKESTEDKLIAVLGLVRGFRLGVFQGSSVLGTLNFGQFAFQQGRIIPYFNPMQRLS